MKRSYTFFDGGTIEFDDRKSVKKLLEHAFEAFGYYEPLGMDIVTVLQCHHPKTKTGWFTTDTNLKCVSEIKNPDELCFAYHVPNVFYFAEGGWGHHMTELGNHPVIENPVVLHLRFEDFNNTVVINGKYSFRDIIDLLKRTDYISPLAAALTVQTVDGESTERIPFSDPRLETDLQTFSANLPEPLAVISIK